MKINSIVKLTSSAFIALALFSSCRDAVKFPGYEYMPDMYRSPSYETYSENDFFKDSISARKPVKGTLPRGFRTFDYDASNDGYAKASIEAHNPLEASTANLEEGKRLFGIYCTPCHGETGQGDGTLVQNGKFPAPPSYSSANSSRGGLMRDLTDGKIYHTITYGLNMMGSHASQLNPDERWKVVMYVHELQKQGSAPASTDSTATAVAPVTK